MNLHLQIQFEKPNTNKNTITNINTNSLHTCVVNIFIFFLLQSTIIEIRFGMKIRVLVFEF